MESKSIAAASCALGRQRAIAQLGGLINYFYRQAGFPIRRLPRRQDVRAFSAGTSFNDAEQLTPATHGSNARRRPQPSRRQQQQELLWGSVVSPGRQESLEPSGHQPEHREPNGTATAINLTSPARPRRQQRREDDNPGAPGGAGDPAPGGFSDVSQLGPAELLAQRDAALLMASGRHRRRQPVNPPERRHPTSVSPVASPAGPEDDSPVRVSSASEEPAAGSGATSSSSSRTRRTGADGGRGLEVGGGNTVAAGVPSADPDPDPDGDGDADDCDRDLGAGGAARMTRGVVLRLRRPEPPVPAARRIRLPLSQRPKPWPLKVLLEQQQQPGEQRMDKEPTWVGHAVEGDPLEQLFGPEEAGGEEGAAGAEGSEGDVGQTPAGTRPVEEGSTGGGTPKLLRRQEQEQLLQGQGQQQEGQQPRPRRGADSDVSEPEGLGRAGTRTMRSGTEGQSSRRQQGQGRWEQQGTRGQQEVRKRNPGAQMEVQKQQEQQEQRKLPEQGEFHRRSATNGSRDDRAEVEAEAVAAHPDGTLWSYRARDVGPLAIRVLQQLQLQSPAAVAGRESEAPVGSSSLPSSQPSNEPGAVSNSSPTSSATGAVNGVSGSDGVDSNSNGSSSKSTASMDSVDYDDGRGSSGGACHVLVAGSYQSYNMLRALSCVQGALRLGAYNSPGGEGLATALSFTVNGVSADELRAYYEQTVLSGTGPPPELGPPPPPAPPRPPPQQQQPAGSRTGAVAHAARNAGTLAAAAAAAPAAGTPDGGGNAHASTSAEAGALLPDNASALEPRALVSVFLVQQPLDLYGGGGGPPVSVTGHAAADVLRRVVIGHLREYGICRVQALGRPAASRALDVLCRVGAILSRKGLGVLAFPRMTPLGEQPRAELPPPAPPLGAAEGRGGRRTAAPRPRREPVASPAAAAVAAASLLDPVLLDKAPQLVLEVVLCDWDERGRPVVQGRRDAAAAARPTGRHLTAGPPVPAPSSPRPSSCSASSLPACTAVVVGTAGDGSQPAPESGKHVTRSMSAAAASSANRGIDEGGGGRGGGRAPAVRLRVPVAGAGTLRLSLDGGDPDTRTAVSAVARALVGGQRARLEARGLGALLRLPVVFFRAQGALREMERPGRSALVFTLLAGKDAEEAPGSGGQAVQQPQPGARRGSGPWRARLEVHRPAAAAAEEKEEEEEEGLEAEAGEGGVLVAEAFTLSVSALQHHLDSLPKAPPPYVVTESADMKVLLAPGDGDDVDSVCSGDVGGGEGDHDGDGDGADGGGNQRQVEAAATAVAENLIRYGSATLLAARPGRRIAALLAAAAVSGGLGRSAGLTVLMRVDTLVRPAVPVAVPAVSDAAPAQTAWRAPPPRRYQLLLARLNPKSGRLQLLRPEDLAAQRKAG